MKILYHHRTRAEDGQAVHIRALQQAFREEGHEVAEVALVQQDTSAGGKTEAASGRAQSGRAKWGWVARLPRFAHELAEYAYTVPAKRRLMGQIAAFEPDFIYERYAFGNAGGVMAASRSRVPLVLEVNSPMVLELSRTRGLSFPGVARKLEISIFRGADRVCVVTQVLAQMLEEMGVESERLLVTPNGVHLEQYEHADPAAARVEAQAELELTGDDAFTIGFVGYYRDWHRLDLVLDALQRPELAEARFAIIGAGPAHEDLVAHARDRGVEGRVHFCGPRPHGSIPKLLPAFDVALVPAINPYASPLKLHEYMASGLAVIAPDQPNLREVVTPDVDGLLIEPGNGEELAANLIELRRDSALRNRLGLAARATIVERDMTWRGNARRVLDAVGELR